MKKYYEHKFRCKGCGRFTEFESKHQIDEDEHVFCEYCGKIAEYFDTTTIEKAEGHEMAEMIR